MVHLNSGVAASLSFSLASEDFLCWPFEGLDTVKKVIEGTFVCFNFSFPKI